MGVSLEEIFDFIGHDGSEKMNSLPDPYCRRGFHIDELIDYALFKNYAIIQINAQPQLHNPKSDQIYSVKSILNKYKDRKGFCVGITSCGKFHTFLNENVPQDFTIHYMFLVMRLA